MRGLALLLLFQAAGEALVHGLSVPFPGPVAGMLMLIAALSWPRLHAPVEAAAQLLLQHLSLLFVPVGVGVIVHLGLVSVYGWQLVVVIVGSTWIGMAVTALVLRALLRNGPGTEGPGTTGSGTHGSGADGSGTDGSRTDGMETGRTGASNPTGARAGDPTSAGRNGV